MLKLLWIFSGDDYRIIASCDKLIKFKFALIGVVVIVIMLLSLLSIQIAIESLFRSILIGFLIGGFFAAVLSVLYILLLQTLSPNLLPHIKPKTIENSRWLRYLFIVFIAVVVSKPIEYWIFKSDVTQITNHLKATNIAELIRSVHYAEERELDYIEKELNGNHLSNETRNKYVSMKNSINAQKEKKIIQATLLVKNSRYFVQGLNGLHEKRPIIWGITLLNALLFLLPILIKLSIPRSSEYMQEKMRIERDLVDENYALTKQQYTELFWKKHGRFVKLYETHLDPPYNTKRIEPEEKNLNQSDLVELIYKKK